jgi:crossover junction endodeoxyribonuclease RuvC
MMFIGIDPGMSGAIAAIDDHCDILLLADCPKNNDSREMASIISESLGYNEAIVAIEKPTAFKMGRTSALNYGTNYGIWLGLFSAGDLRIEIVTPQKWQKGLLSKTDGAGKERSLKVARRLFPDANLKYKKHHGRADALLIADWLRRQYVMEAGI